MSARLIKAPERVVPDWERLRIFLAGSIEMGAAENWQTKLETALSEYEVDLFNPRRDDWNSSWEQKIDNPQFNEQVTWELEHLETADLIAVYFDPSTKSPITLMELGLFASHEMIVCCPEGFWRKGNVDIVCQRYDIPLTDTFDTFVKAIENFITEDF